MVEERYEIRGKIGQGGVGAVYKAYDTQLRREVAIKRVLADELDMNNENATKNLLQEATALSSVQHPHICTVYDAGLDDEGPFVVMELINGKTLDEMVERGTLTYADFREVAIQSQEAMIAAQELNLVHRDLKPSNVMVSWLPSGRFQVKLVDFGLAKFSPKPSLQTIDHGDSVFGSIFFMAPEQFERIELDQRTDMYSLGAMFYFTLAGVYPFNGDTAPQVMAAHLQHSVHPLHELRPDLPHWLCEWVMWHIQKEMDHRPDSARFALEKFLADEASALHTMTGTQQQAASPTPVITPANIQGGPSNATAPQPILAPDGRASTSTSPVAIQPAGAMTGQVQASTQTGPQAESNIHSIQSSGLNKKLVFGVCAFLIAGIIGVCIALFGADEEKKLNDKYSELIINIEKKFFEGESLLIDNDQLNTIFKVIENPEATENRRVGGYFALSIAEAKDDSFSPTIETAKFATTNKNLTDETKRELFQSIALNPKQEIEAYKELLRHAADNPNKAYSADIIRRMKKFASESHLEDILNVYEGTKELTTQTICVDAISEITTRTNSKTFISNSLIKRYTNSSEKPLKLAYLRILGITGSEDALNILTQALNSDDRQLKISASKGLSKFPNSKPFSDMLTVFSNENTEVTNKSYRNDIFQLLANAKNMNDASRIEHWYLLVTKAPSDHSRKHIISKIASKKISWALEVLKKIIGNDSLDDETRNHAKNELEKWNK